MKITFWKYNLHLFHHFFVIFPPSRYGGSLLHNQRLICIFFPFFISLSITGRIFQVVLVDLPYSKWWQSSVSSCGRKLCLVVQRKIGLKLYMKTECFWSKSRARNANCKSNNGKRKNGVREQRNFQWFLCSACLCVAMPHGEVLLLNRSSLTTHTHLCLPKYLYKEPPLWARASSCPSRHTAQSPLPLLQPH